MASVASYIAGVSVRYQRDINIKIPNTDKEIEEFLKSKDNRIYKTVPCTYEDITIENIKDDIVGFIFSAYWVEYNYLEDEAFFEYLHDINEDSISNTLKIVKVDKEYLRFIDLDIAKEYVCIPLNVNKVINLGGVENSIYCRGDNTSSIFFNIPSNIIEDYKNKKCVFELSADGIGDC
jgi:hypothetical protein